MKKVCYNDTYSEPLATGFLIEPPSTHCERLGEKRLSAIGRFIPVEIDVTIGLDVGGERGSL